MGTMRCEVAREALSARFDGEREPIPSARVDEHLDVCAECRQWWGELGSLHFRTSDLAPELSQQILATLDSVNDRNDTATSFSMRMRRALQNFSPKRDAKDRLAASEPEHPTATQAVDGDAQRPTAEVLPLHGSRRSGDALDITIAVTGMHCQGCVSTVTDGLLAITGVESVEIDLDVHATSWVRIHVTGPEVSGDSLASTIPTYGNFDARLVG